MKNANTALQNLLTNQSAYFMADFFTITLSTGTVLRYTTADVDLVANTFLFSSVGAYLARGNTRVTRGIEVDTLDVSIYAGLQQTVNGVPWLQAIANGVLDGATIKLERGFAADPSSAIVGTIILFSGRVAESTVGTSAGTLTVRSDLEILDIKMPRNLYQSGCINTLFDAGCGVNKVSFVSNAITASGSTQSILLCNLSQANDYFTFGEITMTSGANAGVRRTVRAYQTGQITLAYPLPKPVTIGDTFQAWPGCDKTSTGCAKFSNTARFRAFPFVPVPETSI